MICLSFVTYSHLPPPPPAPAYTHLITIGQNGSSPPYIGYYSSSGIGSLTPLDFYGTTIYDLYSRNIFSPQYSSYFRLNASIGLYNVSIQRLDTGAQYTFVSNSFSPSVYTDDGYGFRIFTEVDVGKTIQLIITAY